MDEKASEWKSRAVESQGQVQQLKGRVKKDIFEAEQATLEFSRKRQQVKQQIKQLKKLIAQEEKGELAFSDPLLEKQREELKLRKQKNQSEIELLRRENVLKRQKYDQLFCILAADRVLSEKFDSNLEMFSKIQQIDNLLQVKAKLISAMLGELNSIRGSES